MPDDSPVTIAADIVSAYVANNSVPAAELPSLINSVYGALRDLATGAKPPAVVVAPPQEPAFSIKKSITPDFIVCLEDGKRFKSLKRHLRVTYGLTPDAYRAKWKLPGDYPMVAPSYAKKRSELARNSGLGRKAGTTITKATT